MLLKVRACFKGMQTRSSLHIGTISTENVYLKLAVLLWISEDSSCSDDFDLVQMSISSLVRASENEAHFIGATLAKNSTIFKA
jgi:hypothetical protein